MIKRVHKKFAIIFAVPTSIVLVIVLFAIATITETYIRNGYQTTLQKDCENYIEMLNSKTSIRDSFLEKEELENKYVIVIQDNEQYLRFKGAYKTGNERYQIIFKAQEKVTKQNELVSLKINDADYFATKMSANRNQITVLVLMNTEKMVQEIFWQRIGLFVIGLLGIICFYVISWIIAGQTLKPVVENNKKQTEFIQAASHELRSPLAVIRANSSAILVDESKKDHYTNIIDKECTRMSRLVDDLLFLAHAENKDWTMKVEEVSIDTIVINCYENFESICLAHHMPIEVELPEKAMGTIRGDAMRLEQVISILVDNAICYSGSEKGIKIKTYEKKNAIYIEVIDYGVGIPNEIKTQIFDKFYRADYARRDKTHFGLGLSIAEKLVEMHEGTIKVMDTLGGGTTFVIVLNC